MREMLNTLSARLLIGSAIPLVLFVGVGVVASVFVTRMVTALRMEKQTLEVIRQAHALEQHLGDISHAVATEAPAKLARNPLFRSGVDRFRRDAQDLRRKVADNEAQRKLLDGALARLEAFDESARNPPARWVIPPDEIVALQKDIGTFIDTEEALLKERHAQAEAQAHQLLPVIGGAVLLALGLALGLALTAARSVTRPVARLRESASRLMAGEYQSVPAEGPTEVADLIVLFNHTALTLTQKTDVLAHEEERYRTYIGAVSSILWTCDAAGLAVSDLPSWRAYTGQGEDEVKGAGWLDAVHPEDRARARAAWQSAVAKKELFDLEYRLRSKSGDYRPFHCRGVPVFNSDGSVREWVGTCTDISENRQRAALEQARDTAEAASRAKSVFLTRMSHELRTPLNAVIGMSRMLSAQVFGPLNAKQADYVADISRAGEHLLALINDILDLSKVEAGKMEVQPGRFSLAEAVEALASTLRPLATAKGLRMVLRPPAEDGPLETDPARFRQVLYNLLSNAIKFTPAGEVGVTWEWVAAPQLDAAVTTRDKAAAVRVAVRDTGVGIAPEEQQTIWEEFRQARNHGGEQQQGTGLGLALTRRLVALLGGSIGLVSAPGQGSTFTFVLPCRLPEQAAPCPEGEPPADRAVALVIEDHEPTNKLLRDWLGEAGLATAWALDGETGLVKARRLLPALIVLDIRLPKLNGLQVLTELKGDPATASIPVVIVTVDEQFRPTTSTAVQEFFVKPVDRERFLRRLQQRLPAVFRAGRPPRVLVVDDDPRSREVLGDVLRHSGAEVEEAENGQQALQRLQAGGVPDLVLLDLLMPEMDGFAVIDQIRATPATANLPIVVVTARELDETEHEKLQGQIQALLQKSVLTPEGLREQLRTLGVARKR